MFIMEPNTTEEEILSPEEAKGKDAKKYQKALETITAIVGGADNMRPLKKITLNATASLVAELFKEEEEEFLKTTKEGLKALLKKHVEVEAEIAKQQQVLDNLKNTKRKEFTEASNKWLNKIDQAGVLTETYVGALKTAFLQEEVVQGPKEEVKAEEQKLL